MAGQAVGIVTLFASGALVDPVTQSYQKALWMLSALVLFGTAVSFLMLYFNPTYKRLEVEKKELEDDSLLGSSLN